MEMSFCHLGFARPVVLLPRHKCYLLLFFQSLQGRVRGRLGGKDRQTDRLTEQKGRERRENPSQGRHHSAYYFVWCFEEYELGQEAGKIVSRLLKWMFMWVKYLSTSHTGFGTLQKAFCVCVRNSSISSPSADHSFKWEHLWRGTKLYTTSEGANYLYTLT